MRNCGFINPEDIDDYLAAGGYDGIKKALKMTQQEVIDEMKTLGPSRKGRRRIPHRNEMGVLQPLGCRPEIYCLQCGRRRPGGFMDRAVLEGDPHSVLEGMMTAGYAIGATKAYVYVRAEYPMAYERTLIAIRQARDRGFLGE